MGLRVRPCFPPSSLAQFFADAGKNSVRAFYDEDSGLGGYIYFVLNPKTSPDEDDSGRYYKFVTTCEVTTVQRGSGEPQLLRPRQSDRQRIERQFAKNEWFTGPFRGRLDRVVAVNIVEPPQEESSL